MFLKTSFLFLLAAYFIQTNNAAPFKDLETAFSAIVYRLKLMHFAVSERSIMEKDILEENIPVIRSVLSDPEIVAMKGDKMESYRNEMRNILNEYEKFKKSDMKYGKGLNKVLDIYFEFVERYVDENSTESSQEVKAIMRAFQEHGFKKFNIISDQRLKEFNEKFYTEVEKYVNGLSEEQKKQNMDLVKFLKTFKEESSLEKQDYLITKTVFVNLEDFMW